jgi:DNA-binding GntR family transcriptional regulator
MYFDPKRGAKYVQYADMLRQQIESGELGPGAALPSENDMIQRDGVSRPMARKAVAILRGEGLVVTVQGVGTRVRELPEVREQIILTAAMDAIARMPTENERLGLEIDYGVPVIEVHIADEVRLHPADLVILRGAPSPAKPSRHASAR